MDDANRTKLPSEPETPPAEGTALPSPEDNASLPPPKEPEPTEEEPAETAEPKPEPEPEPVEPKKPEPKANRHLDPDLVGELAEALLKLPDFKDKKILKELLAEAVDLKELQSRSEGGKQRFYQDDLPFVGWIKQMRGNTNSPISLGFYLNGIRSGPWATWTGGRRLREIALYDEGRLDGLQVKWYGSGKKQEAAIYNKDIKHGYSIIWYGSGKKSAEGSYKEGKKDGLWITYQGSGKERQRLTYNNGSAVRE